MTDRNDYSCGEAAIDTLLWLLIFFIALELLDTLIP